MSAALNQDFECISDALTRARRAGTIPTEVKDIYVTLRDDHAEDPGAFVLLVLDDDAMAGAEDREPRDYGRDAVREAIDSCNTGRWPYLRIRSASEHAALGSEEFEFRHSVFRDAAV